MLKILFIAPVFFDYYKLIINNLKEKGHSVIFFQDIHSSEVKYKEQEIELFYKNFIKECNLTTFDIVFIIKGDKIPLHILDFLKERFSNAYFVNYLWDDVNRFKGTFKRIHYYDTIISYSRLDSKDYNFKFYPLFYEKRDVCLEKKYDICFVGTCHTDRMELLNDIVKRNPHLKFYIYLYCPKSILFTKKGILGFLKGKLHLHKIGYNKMMSIMAKSKAVLDIAVKEQFSPSTRAIEAISTKTKVISTCQDIINYDYYDSQNIDIVDRNKIIIDRKWLASPYKRLHNTIEEKYLLTNWVDNIILNTKCNNRQ